jgi:hypothetical protein
MAIYFIWRPYVRASQYISTVNQPHAPVSQIYLFWFNTVPVSDGLSVHHQEFKTVHTATGICHTDTATCLSKQTAVHVESYSLNKCKKLVHLVGFTTEIYYFNFVRILGLKKPGPELWTLTIGNKRPAEIQTKYAINTQYLDVFTSVLHVAANSNRHQAPLLRNFNNISALCNVQFLGFSEITLLHNALTFFKLCTQGAWLCFERTKTCSTDVNTLECFVLNANCLCIAAR